MKSLIIGATRSISEQNTPLASQTKAAAIRIARTVINPWKISAIGAVIAVVGILFWHDITYKVGAVIAVASITIALMRDFLQDLKGGKR